MTYLLRLLLIGFVMGAAALSSCRTTRPAPPTVTAEASRATAADTTTRRPPLAAAPRPDSVRVNPVRWLLDKVRGKDRPGRTYVRPATVTVTGKKSTVTVYNGPAHVTNAGKKAQVLGDGATVQAKKAGPVIKADSGAHVAVVSQGIAQDGQGNVASMPAPAPKVTIWQRLGDAWRHTWPWLLTIGGAAGLYFLASLLIPLLFAGAPAWLLALLWKRKNTDS